MILSIIKTDQKNSVFMIFDLEFTIVILMLMNMLGRQTEQPSDFDV